MRTSDGHPRRTEEVESSPVLPELHRDSATALENQTRVGEVCCRCGGELKASETWPSEEAGKDFCQDCWEEYCSEEWWKHVNALNSMNEICLFVGGPADGKRIRVDFEAHYWVVIDARESNPGQPFTTHRYHISHFVTPGGSIRFCHSDTISAATAIQQVFDRYPEP